MTDKDQMKLDALWEEHGDHRRSAWYDEAMDYFDPELPAHVSFHGQVLPNGEAVDGATMYAYNGETELNMDSAFVARCVSAVVDWVDDNGLWEVE